MQTKHIAFTKTSLPHGWLGNMSAFPIEHEGKIWRTTEALFQAMRFSDNDTKESIRAEKSPMGAKLKAKANVEKMVVEQLSDKDVENMEICVRIKIHQHPSLKEDLLATGDIPIFEDVTKRGNKGSNLFWGAMFVDGDWVGKNTLGNIWMKIRDEIKNTKNNE